MKFIKIKETCLYIHDLEKAKTFYNGVLELPIISYLPDRHIFFSAGGSVLLCFNPKDSRNKVSPPGHFAEGKQHFAFEVAEEEYEKSKKWIQNKGIMLTDVVKWQGGAESFYFEDPEGNVLEIVPNNGIWP